jgi:hypothetical protein
VRRSRGGERTPLLSFRVSQVSQVSQRLAMQQETRSYKLRRMGHATKWYAVPRVPPELREAEVGDAWGHVGHVLSQTCPTPQSRATQRHRRHISLSGTRGTRGTPQTEGIRAARTDWTAADWRGWYEERAALLEHEAGLTRSGAEARALTELAVKWADADVVARDLPNDEAERRAVAALAALGIAAPRAAMAMKAHDHGQRPAAKRRERCRERAQSARFLTAR